MLLFEVLGWAGTIAVLAAYLLVSLKRMDADSVLYQVLNLFGALAILVNSSLHGAIPSAALNVVWMGIAGFALAGMLRRRRA